MISQTPIIFITLYCDAVEMMLTEDS
jgi:hypothetical protein